MHASASWPARPETGAAEQRSSCHGAVGEVALAQRRVTVSVPATVANLGPGLETVGLAEP